MKRCVMVVFNVPTDHPIQQTRAIYDPAATSVAPHITLVFPKPYQDLIDEAPVRNLDLSKIPRTVTFDEVVIATDDYLWLIPHAQEWGWITKLSHELYSAYGIPMISNFRPHLTIGKDHPFDLSKIRRQLKLPIMLKSSSLMLEEFAEDGISSAIVSAPL